MATSRAAVALTWAMAPATTATPNRHDRCGSAWGVSSVRVPYGNIAAFLSLDGKRADAVTLVAEGVINNDKIGPRRGSTTSCSVASNAIISGCTLQSGQPQQLATILEVKGPPGVSGRFALGLGF